MFGRWGRGLARHLDYDPSVERLTVHIQNMTDFRRFLTSFVYDYPTVNYPDQALMSLIIGLAERIEEH